MRRTALLTLLLSGCVERVTQPGHYTPQCPDLSVAFDVSCIHIPSAVGWLFSVWFVLYVPWTLSAIRERVDRIERKLNEKPPAPPSDAGRS